MRARRLARGGGAPDLSGMRTSVRIRMQTTYCTEEIDGIAACCDELERCFDLPIAMASGRRVFDLRLAPAANNQQMAINWASHHEFGAIAQLGERLAGSQKVVGSSPTSSTPRPS